MIHVSLPLFDVSQVDFILSEVTVYSVTILLTFYLHFLYDFIIITCERTKQDRDF